MSVQVKAIKLQATYESNLAEKLRSDAAQIKSIRRQLEKTPIRLPVRLDTTALKSDAARAAADYKKAFTAAMGKGLNPGGSTTPGGIIIPASAMQSLGRAAAATGNEIKRVTDLAKDGSVKAVQSLKQLEAGLQRIETTRKGKGGKTTTSSRVVDTRPTESLKQALAQIERDFATRTGAAKGNRGDLAGVLTEKRNRIDQELKQFSNLENTPQYQRAMGMMDRLNSRIAQTEPNQKRAAEARRAAQGSAKAGTIIDRHKARLDSALKANKAEESAARTTGDRATREQQVNRVLTDREKLLARHARHYDRLARTAEKSGLDQAAGRFRTAGAGHRRELDQVRLDRQRGSDKSREPAFNTKAGSIIDGHKARLDSSLKANKADESAARLIRDRGVREQEINRVLNQREQLLARQARHHDRLARVADRGGMEQAAGRFRTVAAGSRRELDQVRLDRTRSGHAAAAQNSEAALNARLRRAMEAHRLGREQLKTEEDHARRLPGRIAREQALNNIYERRRQLLQSTQGAVAGVHSAATRSGNRTLAGKAESAQGTLARIAEQDFRRVGTSARQSGHAIDFHSSSLARNAATFTKWFVPAQLVMGTFRAIGAGARSAIAVDRTFKTLNAVFRGTREESELLATQTLQLAAANGRSGQEAAEAAVSWARIGLTRIQILTAMETSLRAANVAQISSAEATKYLTANYKAFNQTILDIPANLDFLNSISNQYNVTVKDLFQGIARTASVARQAGVEYQNLASIIGIVSDVTGRPGEETGNALKFILTRIRRTQTLGAIQKEFGLDLTEPSGDAMKMTDILGKLAGLYPNLSRLEKARLNDLVAGSRQTERYAVIVENWTEILAAQGKAALDANSAQRENAEILTSVESKLEKLSTSWTSLIHTIGMAGVFDAANKGLESMAEAIAEVSARLDELAAKRAAEQAAKDKTQPGIRVETARTQALLDTAGHFGKLTTSSRFMEKGQYDPEIIRKAIDVLEGPDPDTLRLGITGGDAEMDMFRLMLKSISADMRKKVLEELKSALGETKGDSAITSDVLDELSIAIRGVQQKKTDSDAMHAVAQAFENIARDSAVPGMDRTKLLKQFDSSVVSLAHLPNGLQEVAKARLEVRPLLEQGRTAEAQAGLGALGTKMREGAESKRTAGETDRAKLYLEAEDAASKLEARLVTLNQQLADERGAEKQKELANEIETVNDRFREAKESALTLTQALEAPDRSILTDTQKDRLNKFFDEIKANAEVIGGVISGWGNTGIAALDSKLKTGGFLMEADMQKDFLKNQVSSSEKTLASLEARRSLHLQNATIARGAGNISAADNHDGIAAQLQDEIKLAEEANTTIRTRITTLEEATAEARRKLEIEQQYAALLQESSSDARASTAAGFERFAIGGSQGEQILNRTRGIMAETAALATDPTLGAGDPAQDAAQLGQLTEGLSQSKAGLLSIEQRMNSAIAQRANMEHEIHEAQRKQREEATKRLALAGREDQLRAAAAKAYLQKQGKNAFSMEEFQYFGQETRGALSNLSPRSVTGLDDSERDNAESRQKLDAEITLLAVSISSMRETFATLKEQVTSVTPGLVEGTKPPTPPAKDVLNHDEVRLNLNVGDVTIALDFATHVGTITRTLQTHLDTSLREGLDSIRRLIPATRGPNTAPAAGAF